VIESRDRYRIGDDRDQELVQHLVPYKLRGLLRELLSLASQSAILRGWASAFPVLVKVNDPPRSKKPRSGDLEFWSLWVGKCRRGCSGTPRRVSRIWRSEGQRLQIISSTGVDSR
jgi:hypothetical protein